MRLRAVSLAAAAACVAMAVPSHAAAPKTLYFANEGGASAGTCTPSYVLAKAPEGNPCSSIQAGYSGNGFLGEDVFSAVKKAVGFKLDASKPVTGVIYLATYNLFNGTPVNTVPGPMAATVNLSINGKDAGTVTVSGQATAPNSDISAPVSFKAPASLQGVVVKSVDVTVTYKTATGVVGTEYSPDHSSKLVFATK